MRKLRLITRQLHLWTAAAILEGLSLAIFLNCATGEDPLSGTLALSPVFHAAAAGVFFLPLPILARFHNALEDYERHLYGWLIFLMPYIGFIGSLANSLLKVIVPHAADVKIYKELTQHEKIRDFFLSSQADEQNLIMEALEVEPIRDILTGRDTVLKLGAIRLLSRRPTPLTVSLLRQALSDPLEEVRYAAHLALIAIEEGFAEKIKQCQEAIKDGREDRRTAYERLGEIYRQYAESGLEGDMTRKLNLERAYEALSQAYALEPGAARTALSLGEVATAQGDYRQAAAFFQSVLQDPSLALDARLGLWRAYFEGGDMPSLQAALNEALPIVDYRTDDPQKIVLFEFWMNPPEAPLGN